jgi:hypothetical protein
MPQNPPANNQVRRAVRQLLDALDRAVVAMHQVEAARAFLDRASARVELHVTYQNGDGDDGAGS